MQTSLLESVKNTSAGQEADTILRACVHCGFCLATCPTYLLEGDELDGPRGRIYLIKQMLEGNEVSTKTQTHLDRCLTCRACETTCPSGVRYARLLEIGREELERQVRRSPLDALTRKLLRSIVPHPQRMKPLLKLGNALSPVLPNALCKLIPSIKLAEPWPQSSHSRRMLVLQGCVQSLVTPDTNTATARVFDRLGIRLIAAPKAGCCGAVSQHLSAHQEGLNFMRGNIDAWWPYVEEGIEAIVITASGCGATVKEYGEQLKHDTLYAERAARISILAKDVSEIIAGEPLAQFKDLGQGSKVAFQTPCTLQHAQQLNGVVDKILTQLGFELMPVPDAHLCCGSAGTYSVLEKERSQRLLENKLNALESGAPEIIATANIGCQMHLEKQSHLPVKHWIELMAERCDTL